MQAQDLRDRFYKLEAEMKIDDPNEVYMQCAFSPRELVDALVHDGAIPGMSEQMHARIIALHPETFRRHRPHQVRGAKLDQLTCPTCHTGKINAALFDKQHCGCENRELCLQGKCELDEFVNAEVKLFDAEVTAHRRRTGSRPGSRASTSGRAARIARERIAAAIKAVLAVRAGSCKREGEALLQSGKSMDEVKRESLKIIIRKNPKAQQLKRKRVLDAMKTYLAHKALNTRQRRSFQDCKRTLGANQVLVVVDFAARFQETYWQGTFMADMLDGVTIPDHVVTLYRRVGDKVEAMYVHMLSESYVREAGGVYVYQTLKLLVDKGLIPADTKQIVLWSDGCSRHYK